MNSLFSMEEAIPVVEDVLKQQAQGNAVNRPRGHDIAGPGVFLGHMQGVLHQQGVMGFKTYSVAPGMLRFLVYLYSIETGELLCIMQAGRLGQLRTGAATGVSAKYMARPDASVVGVLGSGFQAGTQLEALCKVRPVTRAKVYSPSLEHRRTYADTMSERLGIDVTPVDSARDAVEGVDVLVTITASRTPVFDGDWLSEGMHIAAVGGANEYITELDDTAIRRADILIVDDIAQAKIECGEFMMPVSRGLILWGQLRELWQVVGGIVPGRNSEQDVTLFKSLGMAIWDVAAAKAVYDKAVAQGVGVTIGD